MLFYMIISFNFNKETLIENTRVLELLRMGKISFKIYTTLMNLLFQIYNIKYMIKLLLMRLNNYILENN
jgi:hypothetical protein